MSGRDGQALGGCPGHIRQALVRVRRYRNLPILAVQVEQILDTLKRT